ncbi:hypothetical protein GGH95_004720, partial [Coemansia sp. RSA 1836]
MLGTNTSVIPQAHSSMDKKRGNDHGFVFTRVRATANATTIIKPLAGGGGNSNENKPAAAAAGGAIGCKRQASATRLDFPEPKRRVANEAKATENANANAELSVPVKKAPQPTPLISRTRTRAIAASSSTPVRASAGSRRRATAGTGAADAAPGSRVRAAGRAAQRKSAMGGGRRRSTFSMRGKRASSIGGGFKAAPHESVAASDFYRHISPELPEPLRLRQLLAWCARRTASGTSDGGGWPAELPPGVRRVLDDALREAVDDVHAAFEKGAIATSWYHRPVDHAESREAEPAAQLLAAHPENLANRSARDRLLARVDALRAEDAAWVRELKRAGAEHARALARLPTAVQALPASSKSDPLIPPLAVPSGDDGCCWQALSFDEAALRYAEDVAPAIGAQLAAAECHVDRAVSDLEVALDAFHLDTHRAAQSHAHAAGACARVAAGLGFAFTQRRARAQAITANAARLPAEAGGEPAAAAAA